MRGANSRAVNPGRETARGAVDCRVDGAGHHDRGAVDEDVEASEPVGGVFDRAAQLRGVNRTAGLTMPDFAVLLRLSEAPEHRLRMAELAALMGLTPSRITRVVDGLRTRDLVTKGRDPADARGTITTLTSTGLTAMREAHPPPPRERAPSPPRPRTGGRPPVLAAALRRARFVSVPVVTHDIDSNPGPQHVAEEILRTHGADLSNAQRGRGWTNTTWLTDELVIRVATEPGAADLLREERLVKLLPAEVGYPTIIDSGVCQGHEWVLTRRVVGENLEEVWPLLDHTARSRAIGQMWERARHIHRVDVAAAAPHARSRSPFFPRSASEVTAALGRLVKAGELSTAQAEGLGRSLDRFWTALPGAPKVLNHGDFCTPNTLWNNGEVVALLDFEFAVIAPVAIDLNEVAKMAFGPRSPEERAPLQDVVRLIVESTLDTAGGPDVLVGYSIMLEMWMLANELAADDTDEAERADSAAMLMAFAEGDGGYFAPLLADIR